MPVDSSHSAPGPEPGRILLVDDDLVLLEGLCELLTEVGYTVEASGDPMRALTLVDTFDPDVVLADVRMPGLDGIELMERVRSRSANRVFIIMTAYSSLGTAVDAIRRGAENFIAKPFRFDALHDMVAAAVRTARFLSERADAPGQRGETEIAGITGAHPSVRALREIVRLVANARSNVLITGEPGTGKNRVARALHAQSRRAMAPFVHVRCGTLDDDFFGKDDAKDDGESSAWESLRGGTLCLDELSRTSLEHQGRLVQLLQEADLRGRARGDGASDGVRVVAIGSTRLDEMVASGGFLKELYYRLNGLRIQMPALRNRRSDIPALAREVLARCSEQHGSRVSELSDGVVAELITHTWPGNVRELEQVLERAVVLAGEHATVLETLAEPLDADAPVPVVHSAYQEERESILRTLRETRGNLTRAARMLGMPVALVEQRLREYER